jgi:hypothetical protein
MSTPVTLATSATPAAPSGPGAATSESGSLFGEVLSEISADLGSGEVTEEMIDALVASGSAPPGGALLVGLNLPIGDARTLTGSTEASPVPGVATAPWRTALPTAVTWNQVPDQQVGVPVPVPPATPTAPSTPDTTPSTVVTPAPLTPAVPGGAPSTPDTRATAPAMPAPTTAPVLPTAQAAAGAVAVAVAGPTTATAARTTPGTQAATVPERVARTAAPGPVTSTVDAGVSGGAGSIVDTAVRSGTGSRDTRSGRDRGDGALSRGPDAAWAPTLAAARADSAVPTTQASTAPTQTAPQTPQLPPAAQLALRLAPLRAGPDGTHTLTIVLNPDELGPVSVVAIVKGDQLSVQLTGATDASRDALRAALPELERDLRDGGFATLTLNVRETPHPEPVRPAWAAPAATPAQTTPTQTTPAQPAQAGQPLQPAAPDGPRPTQQHAPHPAPVATPVAPTATEFATGGTGTTTAGTKNDSQPVGQLLQPDGATPTRRDDGPGPYNAAGTVAPTHQSSGAAFGSQTGGYAGTTGQQPQQQPSQPTQQLSAHTGFADQQQPHPHQQHGGRHPGTGPDAGPQAGDFEPDPRVAENAPGDRRADRTGAGSVDLRV